MSLRFPLLLCVLLFFCAHVRAGVFNPLTSDELIAAMNTSNTNDQADTINLTANGTYTLLTVNNSDDYGDNGLPIIADDVTGTDLTIKGNGATITRSTVFGTPDFRILQITSGATANISGVTISNGSIYRRGGGFPTLGAGIFNNGGTLNLHNSTISNNTGVSGGGINNYPGSTLNISNSTISNNIGGGIFSNADMTVNNSTISNNTLNGSGGGIFTEGSLRLHNSTISNNSATGSGGGISNTGNLSVSNSTITGNRAAADSYFYSFADGGGIIAFGIENLSNTIVAGNLIGIGGAPDDIRGHGIDIANANLIGDAATSGGIVDGTNGNIVGNNGTGTRVTATILNRTLADNGGPTLTHALATGSPALDAGNNALALTVDQRGAPRPIDGPDANTTATVDIGAVEQGSTPNTNGNSLVVNKIADTNDGLCTTSDCSLREAITAANLDGVDSAITFDIAGAGPHIITLNSALPDLSTNINIDNDDAAAEAVTVSRNTAQGTPAFRIFFIPIGVTVSLSGLAISNGSAPFGGGIDNRGTLNVSNCTLSNNSAVGGTSSGTGGGIDNDGTLNVSNCTLSNNSAQHGGGITSFGTLNMINSTVSNNSATNTGGGIFSGSVMTLSNCTITGNRADSDGDGSGIGGGIRATDTETLNNTIVAGNLRGMGSTHDDISGGTIDTANFNLIGDAATSDGITHGTDGNIVGNNGTGTRDINTILNPSLANNGGPTLTHALVNRSPAINKGNSALPTDQRGVIRPQGSGSDIGAYESVQIEISDKAITEGDSGTTGMIFTVRLSTILPVDVSFNYETVNNASAKPGSDFTTSFSDSDDATPGTLTIPAGQITGIITVPIVGDTINESSEVFYVLLSNASNGIFSKAHGVGTITDNDAPPTVSIDDISVKEYNGGQTTAVLRLRLSSPSGQVVRVNYATANGTATAGSDYVAAAPTQVAFPTNNLYAYARVLVNGDLLNEPNETFLVNLSSAINATIVDSQAVGTILNDDAAPALTINDVSIVEGPAQGAPAGTKQLTFTVTLSKVSGQSVSVNFATANGIARSDSDYVAKNGTLTFAPGVTTQTVSITINGDTLVEADETFYVILSGAANAAIGRGRGVGTIQNDDASG